MFVYVYIYAEETGFILLFSRHYNNIDTNCVIEHADESTMPLLVAPCTTFLSYDKCIEWIWISMIYMFDIFHIFRTVCKFIHKHFQSIYCE